MIYGGISNVTISVSEIDLGYGVSLRQTYAHLMSPFLMAFSPAPEGGAHPPPWKAASGGDAYDIHVEIAVTEPAQLPAGLSGNQVIWLIAALLRIASYPYLSVVVLSDVDFSSAARAINQPNLKPFEVSQRSFKKPGELPQSLSETDIAWVRRIWPTAADMMNKSASFRSAFKAFDESSVVGRTSASLLAVWGGLEQLFSPSGSELSFRVSAYVASYLQRAGDDRLRLFKTIQKLYGARSKAAHTANDIDRAHFIESFVIMRNILVRILDDGKIPTQDDLQNLLFVANK